ncbi:hypothetical protein BH09VER1_BH09VER1_52980 [soil metagenome]
MSGEITKALVLVMGDYPWQKIRKPLLARDKPESYPLDHLNSAIPSLRPREAATCWPISSCSPQAASLAGLAPFNRDSGQFRG